MIRKEAAMERVRESAESRKRSPISPRSWRDANASREVRAEEGCISLAWDNCCNQAWVLKKSLRGSGREKDHARMPYNRRSWLG